MSQSHPPTTTTKNYNKKPQQKHALPPKRKKQNCILSYRVCVLFLRRPNAICILGLVVLRPLAAVFDLVLRGDGCTTNIFPSSPFPFPSRFTVPVVVFFDVFSRTWGGEEARGLLWRR
jgi:hypothetical protein